MSTGAEIEKLATCDQLIGVGGADGIVRIIKNCTVIAKWSAHRQQGIIIFAKNTHFNLREFTKSNGLFFEFSDH